MLRKTKSVNENKNENENENENKNESTTPAPVSVAVKTIIGETISIEGSIQGKGNLVIEGTVKGKIELEKHHLTVGPKGHVEAEIHADNVTIRGRLIGNIKARGKVEITKGANFSGEIKAKRISVEDGAYLKAVIELERESLKEAVPVGKLHDEAASGPAKQPLVLADAGKGK